MHTNLRELWEMVKTQGSVVFLLFVFVLNKVLLRTSCVHSSLLGFPLRIACQVIWPTSWRWWVKLKNMEKHRNIWQPYPLALLSWWPFKVIQQPAIFRSHTPPADTNFPTSSFGVAVMALRHFLVIVVGG